MTKNKDGTFTITLSAEALAIVRGVFGNVIGSSTTSARKYTDEIYDATGGPDSRSSIAGKLVKTIDFVGIPVQDITLAAIEYGFKDKPAQKLRMPDGKYAPANYRVIKYPERGSGYLRERHVLLGAISGNNVAVKEWNGKEWLPKTYTLSKIRG